MIKQKDDLPLNGDERALLVYREHCYHGKTRKEIADLLDLSLERVRQLLKKGYRLAVSFGMAIGPPPFRTKKMPSDTELLINEIVFGRFEYKPSGGSLAQEAKTLGLDIVKFDEWLAELKPCMVKDELLRRRAKLALLGEISDADGQMLHNHVIHFHRMMIDQRRMSRFPRGTVPYMDVAWGENY